MRKLAMAGLLLIAFCMVIGSDARADDTLWYNGDLNYNNALSNEYNTSISQSYVYDDFNVPSGGWTINSIWSNNLTDLTTSLANWQIRSGISAGNGGTLIASGTNAAASQTATGRNAFGYNEYTIYVTGLDIALSEGTYWLTVAPIGQGTGRSFLSMTSGTNAIGTPAGNNANAYINSAFFGYNYNPTTNVDSSYRDFSMGVSGARGINTTIPEPATMALVGLGALGLLGLRKQKNS